MTCRPWVAKAIKAPTAMNAAISFLCHRMRFAASLGSVGCLSSYRPGSNVQTLRTEGPHYMRLGA